MTSLIGGSYSFPQSVLLFFLIFKCFKKKTKKNVIITFPAASCSAIHRVFISNLQKEIEKQTGYRSSRKRRSEFQYDYEVYHSLEEVAASPTTQTSLSHSPLLSHCTHTQSKQTSSAWSSPQTISIPRLPNMQ